MLSPREAVRTLPSYNPPLAGRDGLRLDFNENTVGCSPRVLECLRQLIPDQLAKYPERAPVEATVADVLGIAAPELLLTNGVDEAIHLLCETYLEPGDEALIVHEPRSSRRMVVVRPGPQARLGQPDGIWPSRMAEMLEVDKAGPIVRRRRAL